MNDEHERTAPTAGAAPAGSTDRRTRWTRRFGLLGLGVAGLMAVGAAAGWHRGAHAHGFGGRWGGWHGDMDPAAMGRRIDAMADWMLADVDATAEQRSRVAAIFKAAASDLRPLRETHQAARRESLQLFAAPAIDRARLEKLRLDQMQLGETASRRMLQAMMDAAEVLTPAQRAQLAERWQQRMQRRHR